MTVCGRDSIHAHTILSMCIHELTLFHNIIIAVLMVQPSTENEIVLESDGRVRVCLTKNLDTAQSFEVDVVVGETAPSDNSATGNVSIIFMGRESIDQCR